MGRPTQLNTPSPLAGEDAIVTPPGPVNVSNLTFTLLAVAPAASRTRSKLTTSLCAPYKLMVVPSQTRFSTLPVRFSVWREARSSSLETLSPPSFAHTALTLPAFPVPVPLNEMLCGVPGALSAITIDPFLTPPMVGWKVTEIVQLAESGSDKPHVFVSAKSPDA